jgi:hypothetical protein
VAFGRLGHPRRDMALVALIGPLTHLALALISAVLLRTAPLRPETTAHWLFQTLYQSILLNLIVAIFNMLPNRPWMESDSSRVSFPTYWQGSSPRWSALASGCCWGLSSLPMLGRQIGTGLNLLRWLTPIFLRWQGNSVATSGERLQ